MDYIGIRQATAKGYIAIKVPGVVDLLYPSSLTRRGRVQGGGTICPTITTTIGIVKIIKYEKNHHTL